MSDVPDWRPLIIAGAIVFSALSTLALTIYASWRVASRPWIPSDVGTNSRNKSPRA